MKKLVKATIKGPKALIGGSGVPIGGMGGFKIPGLKRLGSAGRPILGLKRI